MTFHRLLFFADSPQTPWPADAGDLTAFSVRFRASAAIDLTAPPFDADRARWTHPTDYAPCQALADVHATPTSTCCATVPRETRVASTSHCLRAVRSQEERRSSARRGVST